MEKLADHYGLPTIHMGCEVARLEKAGRLVFKGDKPKTAEEKAALGDKMLFSPDAVHPYTDTGHQLYLEAVVRAMDKIKAAGKPGPHRLGAPLVEDHWAAAQLLPLDRAQLSPGWRKLDPATNKLARSFQSRLPQLWQAGQPGDNLAFKFKGIAAGIYDLLGPDCGQLRASVDGAPPKKVARFDSFCTYHRLGQFMAASGLPAAVHAVKIEVVDEPLDKAKILGQRQEKMNDPKRFEGSNWYAGCLMLIGDLAE